MAFFLEALSSWKRCRTRSRSEKYGDRRDVPRFFYPFWKIAKAKPKPHVLCEPPYHACQAPFDLPEIPEPFSFTVSTRLVRTHVYSNKYFVRPLFAGYSTNVALSNRFFHHKFPVRRITDFHSAARENQNRPVAR